MPLPVADAVFALVGKEELRFGPVAFGHHGHDLVVFGCDRCQVPSDRSRRRRKANRSLPTRPPRGREALFAPRTRRCPAEDQCSSPTRRQYRRRSRECSGRGQFTGHQAVSAAVVPGQRLAVATRVVRCKSPVEMHQKERMHIDLGLLSASGSSGPLRWEAADSAADIATAPNRNRLPPARPHHLSFTQRKSCDRTGSGSREAVCLRPIRSGTSDNSPCRRSAPACGGRPACQRPGRNRSLLPPPA